MSMAMFLQSYLVRSPDQKRILIFVDPLDLVEPRVAEMARIIRYSFSPRGVECRETWALAIPGWECSAQQRPENLCQIQVDPSVSYRSYEYKTTPDLP